MKHGFFVALGVASLVFVHGRADACSPPSCWPAVAPRGGNLPGNALAIPYRVSSGDSAAAPAFHLEDAAGSPIATTVADDPFAGGKVLVPAAKLPAGKVDLVWTETCGTAAGEMRRSFSVGSDVALPAAAGTLKAGNRAVKTMSVVTSSGSCFAQVEAVTFDLTLDPTNELRAYREITSYKVMIDGVLSASPYYGTSVEADDGPLSVATLHAVCANRKPYDDNGPELGVHTVSVQAHVAGAATDPPPVKVAVNFSCTDATVPQNPADEATSKDPAAPNGGSPNPGPFSDPSPARAPDASTPAAESGCNASASNASSPLALLAVAFGLTRWRRRAAALSPSREASRKR